MLTILCVTQAKPHAFSFLETMERVAQICEGELVIAADGQEAFDVLGYRTARHRRVVLVTSTGLIEGVLDEAISHCRGDYVLRLDDDEQCSPAMFRWLAEYTYEEHDHWSFPRAHFWGSREAVITTPPLYPDLQTRLSTKAKSGDLLLGKLAPVYIEHHKFLVRPVEEADVLGRITLVEAGDGTAPWHPDWYRDEVMERSSVY